MNKKNIKQRCSDDGWGEGPPIVPAQSNPTIGGDSSHLSSGQALQTPEGSIVDTQKTPPHHSVNRYFQDKNETPILRRYDDDSVSSSFFDDETPPTRVDHRMPVSQAEPNFPGATVAAGDQTLYRQHADHRSTAVPEETAHAADGNPAYENNNISLAYQEELKYLEELAKIECGGRSQDFILNQIQKEFKAEKKLKALRGSNTNVGSSYSLSSSDWGRDVAPTWDQFPVQHTSLDTGGFSTGHQEPVDTKRVEAYNNSQTRGVGDEATPVSVTNETTMETLASAFGSDKMKRTNSAQDSNPNSKMRAGGSETQSDHLNPITDNQLQKGVTAPSQNQYAFGAGIINVAPKSTSFDVSFTHGVPSVPQKSSGSKKQKKRVYQNPPQLPSQNSGVTWNTGGFERFMGQYDPADYIRRPIETETTTIAVNKGSPNGVNGGEQEKVEQAKGKEKPKEREKEKAKEAAPQTQGGTILDTGSPNRDPRWIPQRLSDGRFHTIIPKKVPFAGRPPLIIHVGAKTYAEFIGFTTPENFGTKVDSIGEGDVANKPSAEAEVSHVTGMPPDESFPRNAAPKVDIKEAGGHGEITVVKPDGEAKDKVATESALQRPLMMDAATSPIPNEMEMDSKATQTSPIVYQCEESAEQKIDGGEGSKPRGEKYEGDQKDVGSGKVQGPVVESPGEKTTTAMGVVSKFNTDEEDKEKAASSQPAVAVTAMFDEGISGGDIAEDPHAAGGEAVAAQGSYNARVPIDTAPNASAQRLIYHSVISLLTLIDKAGQHAGYALASNCL